MNRLNAHEKETFFVPPKPSCRKPLNRMIDEDTPPLMSKIKCSEENILESERLRRTNPNDSCDGETYEDSNISDDYDEHENIGDAIVSEAPGNQHRRTLPSWPEPESCALGSSERRIPESPALPTERTDDSKYLPNYETTKSFTLTSHPYESTRNSQGSPSEIRRDKSARRDSVSKLKRTRNVSNGRYCFYCLIAITLIVAMCWSMVSTANSTSVKTADESRRPKRLNDFRDAIAAIKDKFRRQSQDTWMDIEAGIAAVIDRSQKISMFVLFSNETRELRCLADYLGSASSKALLSENSLSLEPEDMGDEYGDTMERWRDKIEEKKAVVVHDLLNVDPRAIQAFHAMCDRVNPLVDGAVYIMTIVTQGYSAGSQSPVKFVENQLTNRFIDKVPADKLQPLITRLMDGPIIPVTPEVGLSGCPS